MSANPPLIAGAARLVESPEILATCGLAVATVAYGTFAPRSSLFGPVIFRGSTAAPARVALTFDDGPHPSATAAILDILAAQRVPAAFFMIGRNVRQYPHLARRASAEGHLIGNHTHDHDRGGAWRFYEYWRRQLREASDAVEQVTGERPTLFRPPMGIKTPLIARAARSESLRLVTWSRRGLDGVRTTPDAILRRLVLGAGAGDILVLHDGAEPGRERDHRATFEALPRLIDGLRARGLEFERLDRLIEE